MKYGIQETDVGNTYYVWKTERNYVFPTDTDIILYIYSGNDMTSPDSELSDSEARNSIQTYMQAFRTEVDGSISVDAGIASNNRWYVLQLTGNSGEYLQTTYGTLCYPKSYYGVYTMQKMTDSYTRDYYGFIFSNDSAGAIIEENEYNNIFGQIKSAFSITEFYTMPQVIYDETTDYSSGYSYKQLCTLFADTANYYGMSSVKNMDAGTENEMETEIDTERSNDYE